MDSYEFAKDIVELEQRISELEHIKNSMVIFTVFSGIFFALCVGLALIICTYGSRLESRFGKFLNYRKD